MIHRVVGVEGRSVGVLTWCGRVGAVAGGFRVDVGVVGADRGGGALPSRCVPWDVAALSVHTVGAPERVLVMLDVEAPRDGEELVSAAGHYAPDARFSPEVNADRVRRAVEVAARRRSPAESGRVLSGWWAELSSRLSAEPVDRVVRTRHGDPRSLTDFLVTRVVELGVHGVDLADALGREPWLTDEASSVVVRLLFEGTEHEVSEGLLPGVWSKGVAGVGAIRAVTGRAARGVDRAVLEEAAGVRFLTLG